MRRSGQSARFGSLARISIDTAGAIMTTLSPALAARLPGLPEVLASIAKGAAQRDHDRVLPFEQIDLIRRARLGAMRIPEEQGGKGGTLRELFAFAITLAEAPMSRISCATITASWSSTRASRPMRACAPGRRSWRAAPSSASPAPNWTARRSAP
jgi:alkylation response protein AidB-like acyl-CoA dehydrogenase